MISVQRFNLRRRRREEAALNSEEAQAQRQAEGRSARRRLAVVGTIAAIIIIAASFRAHRVLAAHAPNDMPANSRWILTGRDPHSNDKLGLWIACWKSTVREVDHCRITNEGGTTEFDGDMLPLAASQTAVPDRDLQLAAKINPGQIWVRGVNDDIPIPVLTLANGTRLVPVSDRGGLQERLARGQWDDGSLPALPNAAIMPDPTHPLHAQNDSGE